MRPQTVMTIAVACGCGLVGAFVVKQAIDNTQPEAEPEVPVLMALKDIPLGVELNDTNVQFTQMKRSAVPKGAVTKKEQYELRALKIPAVMGETILVQKLGKPGEAGKSMMIPDGYRAVGLSVDEESSFSSMLAPGDRVDVLATFQQPALGPDGRRTTVTKNKVLLEYLEVFAVDNRTFGGSSNKSTEDDEAATVKASHVHLLVKPEQAKLFLLAKEKAKLSLTWRSRTDDADHNENIIDESILDDLNNSVPSSATTNTALAALQEQSGTAAPVESELETDMDFKSFLDEIETESVDTYFAPQTTVEVAEVKPTWTMTIYNGAMAEQVEVQLTPAETDASADAAGGMFDQADGEAEVNADGSTGWFSKLSEKLGPRL